MVGFDVSLLFLILLAYGLQTGAFPPNHKVNINGKFTCQGKALFGQKRVRVEIWEVDTFRDDHLFSGWPLVDGTYRFTTSHNEYGGIKPYVYIYHSCGGHCRKITFEGDYINPGRTYELKDKGQIAQGCEEQRFPASYGTKPSK
ncbi:unnamed protein product [Bursaphelenchus xylophilus]|uniref:(pine wood nematode) hypothetical protein n=1 Tax=Bursaphelenchus xylophilus TaxID=6326 RepID=A0A1I7SL33_BURXY|nr:unnamed protein product [Bursaphelenchus xylophilus]CAG9129352.1 unnamed protein product [Bursaphelenchus xylophilus]